MPALGVTYGHGVWRGALPGFDELILGHIELQAVMREPQFASWRTALGAVKGVYLITDTEDVRQCVGKTDGADTLRARWSVDGIAGRT